MDEKQSNVEQNLTQTSQVQDEVIIVIRNGKVVKFVQRLLNNNQQGLYGEGI